MGQVLLNGLRALIKHPILAGILFERKLLQAAVVEFV